MQLYKVYNRGHLFRLSISEVMKRLVDIVRVYIVFVSTRLVGVKLTTKAIDSGAV